jgi:hypothetical protein
MIECSFMIRSFFRLKAEATISGGVIRLKPDSTMG